MRHSLTALLLSLCIALAGCSKDDASAPDAKASSEKQPEATTKPVDPRAAQAKPAAPNTSMGALSAADKARLEDTIASSFGKGSFEDEAGNTFTFTMEGSVLSDKSGYGEFRFYSFQGGGKLDVQGEMTCVHIDSAERRIWLAGEIVNNTSTDAKFSEGKYATGKYVQFRARPNSMDGKNPAAIEAPSFVDQASAEAFCAKGDWNDDALYELGENDLIAAIP